MAIIGIGIDLVEISRIESAYKRYPQFVTRIFTDNEQEICLAPMVSFSHLAGRFAAKEAVSKALRTGIGKVGWRDIEILKSKAGAPEVILHNEAKQKAEALGVKSIHCTISHEKNMATAMIILEG